MNKYSDKKQSNEYIENIIKNFFYIKYIKYYKEVDAIVLKYVII